MNTCGSKIPFPHLTTSSNHSTGSSTSTFSQFTSSRSSSDGSLISMFPSPPPRIVKSNSIGTIGEISINSLCRSTSTTDTNGYVYRPTAVVLSDEYYYSRMKYLKSLEPKRSLKRTSSFASLGKLSDRLLKRLKSTKEKK
ncbi:hypothetical protein DFH28DRAFT_1137590 [Melampsora americana]|nr:hypothetical protein DFH28DRAFT_1137590 [Melampsora americana]